VINLLTLLSLYQYLSHCGQSLTNMASQRRAPSEKTLSEAQGGVSATLVSDTSPAVPAYEATSDCLSPTYIISETLYTSY
jgi:hypothetical protein